MSTPLDAAAIAKLLQEEATAPSRTRGAKVDPTADRSINGWFKLNHHICIPGCEHRSDPNNPTTTKDADGKVIDVGSACWNPDCFDHTRVKDPTQERYDRGANIVSTVKGQNICRYCYLAGYLEG